MPFVFIVVGIVLLVSGARDTSSDLLTLLKGDITGNNNFLYWIISIAVIGSVGYIQDLRSLSRAFLVLVIVVLVLNEDKQGGHSFFTNFQSEIASITAKGG